MRVWPFTAARIIRALVIGRFDLARSSPLVGGAIVGTFALVLLTLLGLSIDLSHVFLRGLDEALNDQAGFIAVARNLAEAGEARATTIYPSLLRQETEKNYFSLPGHYWALAASFRLFGYGVLGAFVPSLIGFVITALATFAIAWRLHDSGTGFLAAMLYAIFPMNLLLAFSAMAEITLTAASTVAVAGFVLLPDRWKPFIGPLLVLLPFVFRETGAVTAVVMFMLLILGEGRPRPARVRDSAVFAGTTIVLLLFVMNTPVYEGRPSLAVNNLIASDDFRVVYSDAFALEGVDASPATIARLIMRKIGDNTDELLHPSWSKFNPWLGERIALLLILVAIPVAAVLALAHRDGLAAGTAAAGVIVVSLLLGTYTVWGYRGTRNLLFLQPLASIVLATALLAVLRRFGRRYLIIAVVIGAHAAFSAWFLGHTYAPQASLRAKGERSLRFLESLGHDDRTVLVAPHWVGVEYSLEHHPVPMAFVPANLRTLRLLEEKLEVGTIVYPVVTEMVRKRYMGMLSIEELEQGGWRAVEERRHEGVRFLVFRKGR